MSEHRETPPTTGTVGASFLYNDPKSAGTGMVYQKGEDYAFSSDMAADPYVMAHLGADPVADGIDHTLLTMGAFGVAESTDMKAAREKEEAAAKEARSKARAAAQEAAKARAEIAAKEAQAQSEAATKAQEAAHAPVAHAPPPARPAAHKGQ